MLISSSEGNPNAVLESLACGTPVVVSDIPENVEAAGNDNGIIVTREPAEIAKGLKKALAGEWDRTSIARKGRERTWNNVSGELNALFGRVLRKAAQPREERQCTR
jgi:Glycosyltransferase